MDGSHFETRYPVVLRFEGIGPEHLAGYEKHRKRVGGDIGHILEHPPAPNRLLIGSEDWAANALAEIAAIKAQNFASELEALEKRKRKKDIQKRLAEGPHNPWRPTRHGPMREVILTANKEWFDADPAAVFGEGVEHNQRISDFEERSIAWLKDAFGDDVIHARADLDEEAYHIHAVIMPRVQVEMTRTDKKTGKKKVIATRLMLQPSKFDVIEDYEHAQDSVGEWFSEIGLDRGERRKAAYREAIAKGETPPPKRMHSKTREWRRKKDLELAKRERDLETRSAVVEEKAAEAETIIEITEAVAQGAVDPSAPSAEDALVPVKGREQDEVFLRAQRHAQRSPKGASRIAKAFRRGWGAMFKTARNEALARVNVDFRAANKTLEEERGLLAKIGGTLGADLSGNISKLPDLARRLKMTILAGNLSHERSAESRRTARKKIKITPIQRVGPNAGDFLGEKAITPRKTFYLIFMPRGNPASSGKNTKPKDTKMSKRMFRKPVKATRKNPAAATMSPAMQAAMFKVANVAANMSRKDEATQQAARKAIADTIEEWIGFLAEEQPEAVEDFYYEVCMLATAGNRRRIAKHSPMPEGVFERVEDDLREQKEEAKREASTQQSADDDAKEMISE